MMRAVTQEKYGSADVLTVAAVDRPTPKADEVLIRVKAAGVNMADWHQMTGEPTVARLALGFGGPREKTRGVDVAGIVEVVGAGVTEFAVGDEVFGSASGSFADFAVSRPKRLWRKPDNVSFEQAGAVSMGGYTALQALRAAGITGASEVGRTVLVIGAAGGVGSFAVQLAKHFGAHVTGVCSTRKVELVKSLRADTVIDYKTDAVTGQFDVVLDVAGGRSVSEGRTLLTENGTLVVVGGEGGGRVFGLAGRALEAPLKSMFSQKKLVGLFAVENGADLAILAELLSSGAITTAIDRTYPLEGVPDALRHLGDGGAAGKVVIVP
jgi:NADPH:quinone reductase-like Zn-dependent oxidoreductase